MGARLAGALGVEPAGSRCARRRPTASASPAGAKASRRTPWRCSRAHEARPLRRPSRPARDPLRDAVASDVPGVHAPQPVGNRYWGRLYDEHPDFQLGCSTTGTSSSPSCTPCPLPWDGSAEDLPSGWDEAFPRAFESGRGRRRCARSRSPCDPTRQGDGSPSRMIERDARRRAHRWPARADRAGSPDAQGVVPADPDRALRGVAA